VRAPMRVVAELVDRDRDVAKRPRHAIVEVGTAVSSIR
jgi:hypothetical protein